MPIMSHKKPKQWMDVAEMSLYFDMDSEAIAAIRDNDGAWLIVREALAGFFAAIVVVDGQYKVLSTFPYADSARRYNLKIAGI
jgi:hypothetical protein